MKINWLYVNVITEVVEVNFGKGNDKCCTGNCLLIWFPIVNKFSDWG